MVAVACAVHTAVAAATQAAPQARKNNRIQSGGGTCSKAHFFLTLSGPLGACAGTFGSPRGCRNVGTRSPGAA
eukprot:11550309-Alexandrium_andersonii.AAC.1